MSNKRQLGMVITPRAADTWQQLATVTGSWPKSGPYANPENKRGAISVLMERISDSPELLGLIWEAFRDDK